MKYLLLFFFLILYITGFSQEPSMVYTSIYSGDSLIIEKYLSKRTVEGKEKRISVNRTWIFNVTGDTINYILKYKDQHQRDSAFFKYYHLYRFPDQTFYRYNEHGSQILQVSINGKSKEIDSTYMYYDAKEKLILQISKNHEREILDSILYIDTLIAERINYVNGRIKSVTKYFYSKKNIPISERRFDPDGSLDAIKSITIGKSGRPELISYAYYNRSRDLGQWNTSFSYDKQGRVIMSTYEDQEEKTSTEYVYEKDILIRSIVYEFGKKIRTVNDFIYDKPVNGN